MSELNIIEENYKSWTKSPFDNNTISEIIKLKKNNLQDFKDSFYKNLSFGTGGMRGVIGLGPNRVNKYTFGRNTQGISTYIKNSYRNGIPSVIIAYDCRNQSEYLANKVAEIFSANGIKVFLFSSIKPTPELSYALVKLKCVCGIVLTASHNPPEYNGYKVYWEDGGQIVPPIDKKLMTEIDKVKYSDINFKGNTKLIELLDGKIDETYIKKSLSFVKSISSKTDLKNLKIVFTSLHGTSYKLLPELLKIS